jgi:nitrogen fixation protein NifU and related proteins
MATLSALYQDVILDHNRRPQNYGRLNGANRRAEGNNPLCGDRLTVWLRIEDDVIQDVAFEGAGCAISKASASLMTSAVKGRPVSEATAIFERFRRMILGQSQPEDSKQLGKLAVFSGVAAYPIRVKCATLGWHALKAALDNVKSEVSTE